MDNSPVFYHDWLVTPPPGYSPQRHLPTVFPAKQVEYGSTSIQTTPTIFTILATTEDHHHDVDHSAIGAIHHTSSLHEYVFPILVLFPTITTIGNSLVIFLCSIMVFNAFSGRTLSSRDSGKIWVNPVTHHNRMVTSTATNCFLISLASADFLIGAVVMPLALYLEWTDGIWNLGVMACDLWLAIDHLATTASILSLTAIAQNRYLAVAKPLTYSKLQRKRKIVFLGIPIGIVWTVSAAMAAPILFGLNHVPNRNPKYCKLYRVEYLLYSSIISFFIPSVAIGLQYVAVFRVLGARARRTMLKRVSVVVSRLRSSSLAGSTDTNGVTTFSHPFSERNTSATTETPHPSASKTGESSAENKIQKMRSLKRARSPLESPVFNQFDSIKSISPIPMVTAVSSRRLSEPFVMAYRERMLSRPKRIAFNPPNSTIDESSDEDSPISPSKIIRRTPSTLWPSGNVNDDDDDKEKIVESSTIGSLNQDRSLFLTPFRKSPSCSSLSTSSAISLPPGNSVLCNGRIIAPPSSKRHSEVIEDEDWLLGIANLKKIEVETDENQSETSETEPQRRISACASIVAFSSNTVFLDDSKPRSTVESAQPNILRKKVLRRKTFRTPSESKVKRDRRATIMLSVVLILFYACWLPYFLATVSLSVCAHFDKRSLLEKIQGDACVPDILMHVLTWLGHANSMANPFVYAVFNPEFRATFWYMFGRKILFRMSIRSSEPGD